MDKSKLYTLLKLKMRKLFKYLGENKRCRGKKRERERETGDDKMTIVTIWIINTVSRKSYLNSGK